MPIYSRAKPIFPWPQAIYPWSSVWRARSNASHACCKESIFRSSNSSTTLKLQKSMALVLRSFISQCNIFCIISYDNWYSPRTKYKFPKLASMVMIISLFWTLQAISRSRLARSRVNWKSQRVMCSSNNARSNWYSTISSSFPANVSMNSRLSRKIFADIWQRRALTRRFEISQLARTNFFDSKHWASRTDPESDSFVATLWSSVA